MYKNSVPRVISPTECVLVAETKSSNNHLVRFADFLPWRKILQVCGCLTWLCPALSK